MTSECLTDVPLFTSSCNTINVLNEYMQIFNSIKLRYKYKKRIYANINEESKFQQPFAFSSRMAVKSCLSLCFQMEQISNWLFFFFVLFFTPIRVQVIFYRHLLSFLKGYGMFLTIRKYLEHIRICLRLFPFFLNTRIKGEQAISYFSQ